MLRFQLVLEIIEKENLLENVQKQGEFYWKVCKNFKRSSTLISNARGRGLMCAFDLPDGKARADFQEKLFEENVIVICGENRLDSVHI